MCRSIYTSTCNTLEKKDDGHVATQAQEVGTYLVYHCYYYLAESCQKANFHPIIKERERGRETTRETEKCIMLTIKIRPPVVA